MYHKLSDRELLDQKNKKRNRNIMVQSKVTKWRDLDMYWSIQSILELFDKDKIYSCLSVSL